MKIEIDGVSVSKVEALDKITDILENVEAEPAILDDKLHEGESVSEWLHRLDAESKAKLEGNTGVLNDYAEEGVLPESSEDEDEEIEPEEASSLNYAFFENTFEDIKQELVDNQSRQGYLFDRINVLEEELKDLVGQEPVLEFSITYTQMLKDGMEGLLVHDGDHANAVRSALETSKKLAVADRVAKMCRGEKPEDASNAPTRDMLERWYPGTPPSGLAKWNEDLLDLVTNAGAVTSVKLYIKDKISSTNKPYMRKYMQNIYDSAVDEDVKSCLYDNFEMYITRDGEDPKVLSACDREKKKEPFLSPEEQLEQVRKEEGLDPDLFDYSSPEYLFLQKYARRPIIHYIDTDYCWLINVTINTQLSLELVPEVGDPYRVLVPVSSEPM